jgi:hypothetical protein
MKKLLTLFALVSIFFTACTKTAPEVKPVDPRYVDTAKVHIEFELNPKDSIKVITWTGWSRAIWIQALPFYDLYDEPCSIMIFTTNPVDAAGKRILSVQPDFTMSYLYTFTGFSYNYKENTKMYFMQTNRLKANPESSRWILRIFKDGN